MHLLQKAANTLAIKLGDWVLNGWSIAYALHVWSFHEGKLSVNDITKGVEIIERMVNEAKRTLSAGS